MVLCVKSCSLSVDAAEPESEYDIFIEDIPQRGPIRSVIEVDVSPEYINCYVGDEAVFYCIVSSPVEIYQWQYSINGTSWSASPLDTANTSRLVVPATMNRNGYYYRCRVKATSSSSWINSESCRLYVSEKLSFSGALSFVGSNIITPIFNFITPWGITFGAVVIGVFGAPLLIKAYKKFF